MEENDSNTNGEGGRAQWNLNVPKPEQEQRQHHNSRHLLSAQSEGMECMEGGRRHSS